MTTKHTLLTALTLVLVMSPAYATEDAKKEAAPEAATEATTSEAAPSVEIKNEGIAEVAGETHKASGGHAMPDLAWSFDGPFGTYDKASLQRGLLVYRQVCSACHGLQKVYYRNLEEIGYSEGQVKAIAAEYSVTDGPNDEGEMFDRPARPSDKFKAPFANDKAAAYANNGALPPDLSLITKARHGGADYVYGILTGYTEPPAGLTLSANQHYNSVKDGGLTGPDGKHIPGGILAMAPPLSDGLVTYEDGSPQTADQYAKDVAHFLTWAAEPEMEHRKQMGIKVIIFLAIFGLIMLATKRKVWEKLH